MPLASPGYSFTGLLPILVLTLVSLPSAYLLTDALTGPGSPVNLSLPTNMLSHATIEYLRPAFAIAPATLLILLIGITLIWPPL